ncbi:hypothetical protein LCGC14_1710870 [marine sediment metagenome]|uniref:Uncharacterized protein n=1 Tax=marine sediment metagenome TaxID=412755 RepID=A0A0F9HEU5_9ZZZZ
MSKTKLQMRGDLRLDLKDSGALWSDAELNRCIDRAYSDLSRFLPDEKIYEDSLQFAVTGESVVFPADTSADAIVADEALTSSSAGDTATIDGQPDVPRPLQITITDANDSITGLTLVVDGVDKDNQALQEVFHFTKGGDKVWSGLKYFKDVYQVEIDQIAGNGADDVLDIGYAAYTTVWVYLANSPIKWASETATDTDSNDIVRNTDFYIDYATGRVKAISGGDIVAGETSTFAYTKSQIGIDISNMPGLIRVQRVEYPVGDIPQTFITGDTFANYYVATGSGESGDQVQWAEDRQYRIYYDARHQPPGEYSPSSAPGFLEDTVLLAAGAYALYIYALKHEHQALTDMASVRTDLTAANGEYTALETALSRVQKYLDNNSSADAAGILQDITDDIAELRTAIETALDLAATYLTGDTAPSAKKYLDDGDATLNVPATGGEGTSVSLAYAEYARTSVQLFSGLVAEANVRIANLRTYIEQGAGYVNISSVFAREVEGRLGKINGYMQEAAQYANAASTALAMSDRFRLEANERRNEVYSIWRDRKQYIGDFTAGSVRQMPDYNRYQ